MQLHKLLPLLLLLGCGGRFEDMDESAGLVGDAPPSSPGEPSTDGEDEPGAIDSSDDEEATGVGGSSGGGGSGAGPTGNGGGAGQPSGGGTSGDDGGGGATSGTPGTDGDGDGSSDSGGTSGDGGGGTSDGGGTTGGDGAADGAGGTNNGDPDDGGPHGKGGGGTDEGGSQDDLSDLPPIEGCTDMQAADVSVSEIALYQAVKIPIMKDFEAVTGSADLVAGRHGLMRVFVTPREAWVPRELGLRVVWETGEGAPVVWDVKKTIEEKSTDEVPQSTFNFFLEPGHVIAAARFSVELFECGPSTGTVDGARYPLSGSVGLAPRLTGPLKVRLVPIAYGADGSHRLPDTSASQMSIYQGLLEAMFPVTGVELSVRTPVWTPVEIGSPSSWASTLDALRALRSNDAPPPDAYYYGLVNPADAFAEYCEEGCITGIAYVTPASASSYRVGLGVGFPGQLSGFTLAHELGHNHGRVHAPCGTVGDPEYPHAGGLTGAWGYDSWRKLLLGPSHGDIMGYCRPHWISDYTYQGLLERVAIVNEVSSFQRLTVAPERWWTLLIDDRGPRWGLPEPYPVPPSGSPRQAVVYDSTGARLAQITVYRTEMADSDTISLMVPEPHPSWAWLDVDGIRHSFMEPVTVVPLQ